MLNDLKAKPGPNWTSILNDKELLGINNNNNNNNLAMLG